MANALKRRSFLKTSSAFALGLGLTKPEFSSLKVSDTTGMLPYRVIYDDDSVNIFPSDEPATPEHLDQYIDKIADAGVDLYLQCAGYHRVFYQSEVWEPWWKEYRERGTIFGKKVEGGWINASPFLQLAEMGVDFMERSLKRARHRGMAAGITMRMDDLHYRGPSLGKHTIDERLSRFYQNEDLYLSGPNTKRHGGRWALNYEKPEVREHYLSLFRELVDRYDFDVLNLDYLRHPPYFDRQELDKHRKTMTGFLRQINRIFESSGKRISLLARVPATPANCMEQGLDVGAWAKEGLVGGIAPGMKNCTGWEVPADAFRRVVGPGVSVYAASERQAGRTALRNIGESAGDASSALRWSREMWRGYAAGHLANGADGIYLFNFFLGNLPIIDVLRDLRSLDQLRGKPKAYRLTSYGSQHAEEVDLPMQVPVYVPAHQARKFEILLAREPGNMKAEAIVVTDRKADAGEVWLQLNETPLGHANRISGEPAKEEYYSWWNIVDGAGAAVFDVPVTAIRDGRNHLVFRNEGQNLNVLGVALRIS